MRETESNPNQPFDALLNRTSSAQRRSGAVKMLGSPIARILMAGRRMLPKPSLQPPCSGNLIRSNRASSLVAMAEGITHPADAKAGDRAWNLTRRTN